MSVLGPVITPLLMLATIWAATFALGWFTARHPRVSLPPLASGPEVSPERDAEIMRSTTRWGWCRVYFLILCVGTMYTVAIILFWPVWFGGRFGSPAGR